MRRQFPDPRLRYFVGDVRDASRLWRAFDGVDYVIHAAALKQVPACEYNPIEATETNVLGARNVIDAAIDRGVKRVVALSTDKASAPITTYGATKLLSDKLFISGNAYAAGKDTRFSVVRYGNVACSRGSVIPFFLQQRSKGLLPITDPAMTRFWLTLDDAVNAVVYAFEHMRGGEIFVPKMRSVRITDVAEAVAPGCRHEYVGLRAQEKLHESMWSPDESGQVIEYDGYYVIAPTHHEWEDDYCLPQGKRAPVGWSYRSDDNGFMSVYEIRDALRGQGVEV
jgi:UDP-N-acetylglucosamine 4,6-dehydratase